ncbi:MAG: hypothetical protein ABI693_13800 [Bryobacteraceae bacterium]
MGLDFVTVLFAIEMHQVEFVKQPEFLEKFKGPIYGRSIYPSVALACQLQQRCSVKMLIRILDRFK